MQLVARFMALSTKTVSEGASFLWIDGREVAAWPGYRGLGGHRDPEERAKHTGKIRLREGIRRLEYVAASPSGGVHLLAWAEPGEERTRPISPRHYVSWRAAEEGPLELKDEPHAPDFQWRQLSDTNSDAERHDLAEIEFRASAGREGRWIGRSLWRFGDGQTARGETVSHVYLKHGVYDVSLDVTVAGEEPQTITRKVAARFLSLERASLDELLEGYHRKTKDCDLAALPEEHLRQLTWLRRKDDRWEADLHEAVEAWYERDLPLSDDGVVRLGLARAIELVRSGERLPEARKILESLVKAGGSRSESREAAAWLAWLRGRGAGSDAAARAGAIAQLRRLHGEGPRDDAARRAGLFLGRLLLRAGEFAEAEKVLSSLEADDRWRRFDGDRTITSSARALGLDNLLLQKKEREARDELARWEWELPRDLLDGTLHLARARFFLSGRRESEALEMLDLLETIPTAAEAVPRSMLLRARILEQQGRKTEAREVLRSLVEKYPARPERKEAEERLAE